jgi:hypothetical protein
MVEGISMKNVLRITAHNRGVFAWTDTNDIYFWGDSACFRLGKMEEASSILSPIPVEAVSRLLNEDRMIYQVAANDITSVALNATLKVRVRHNDEQETFIGK